MSMHVLEVGRRSIPYVVRRSAQAKRKRIVVTPERVEVVAPLGNTDEEVARFVHARRRWVHDETERMRERTLSWARPERFVSGAKVLYRGRRLRLTVEPAEVDEVEIECRSAFHVRLPIRLASDSADQALDAAFRRWFRDRVFQDAVTITRRFAPRLGAEPAGVRVREQKHLWGSCGRDGTIYLNWHLAFAPKPVLEYAVVHEMCHLLDRSHDPSFWQLLSRVMPDYADRKLWLEQNELSCRWG
jgi:predicted metal-dependent hydrolase